MVTKLENRVAERTAAKKKPVAEKESKPSKPNSRTDGAKPSELETAIKMIEKALDAVHDCAPNGKDYREDDDEFDSKTYQREVGAHSDRIHSLNDIREELSTLLTEMKGVTKKNASSTTMKKDMWYHQEFQSHGEMWFYAEKEQKNGGFAGKQVELRGRNMKAIKTSVPKAFWSLWKEVPESAVPAEVKEAL